MAAWQALVLLLPFLELQLLWGIIRLRPRQSTTSDNPDRVFKYRHCLGDWYSKLIYLWRAPNLVAENYAGGRPFILPTPAHDYVHVSSPLHVKELSEAPEDVLSLHAVSKEMLQPKYTMEGLNVAEDMADNGSIHTRVLRVTLRSYLPRLQPEIGQIISMAIDRHVEEVDQRPGTLKVQSFAFTKRIFTLANARIFFGKSLCHDPEILTLAEDYLDHLVQAAEVLRLVPSWSAPLLAPILMRSYRASRGLTDRLLQEVQLRMETRYQNASEKPIDLIQFFVDSSRSARWKPIKIVQVILGIWFASVHQPALSSCQALDDLCQQPESQDLIYQELTQNGRGEQLESRSPFLGAFLKESCRLHPSDSISVRREVLKPFEFSDGVTVNRGSVICVPLLGILHDHQHYPEPQKFDALRHLPIPGAAKPAGLTDLRAEFPLWGLGKHACPGRYYASMVMQQFLASMVLKFRMQMPEESRSRFFTWRTAFVPRSATCIFLERRSET